MLKSISKSRQSGFTLVELGIVLALIGIGLFFAISKMQETGNTSRAQNAASEISTTITNLQSFYGTASAFPATVGAADMINNRLVPEKWINRTVTPNTLQGPFGTAPTVAQFAATAPGNTEANITLAGVPSAICPDMVRTLSDGVRTVSVNGVVVKPLNGTLNFNTLGTNCNQAGGIVTVVLRFQKA